MNQKVCVCLVSGCWFLGMVDGFVVTPIAMNFPFCHSRKILSFFCEAPALLKLSCYDISLYKMLMYLCCILMLLIPIVVISSSYALILHLIHRINSAKGHRKAFATCSSHMTVVLLFFGATIYTYMLPDSYHTAEQDMMVSAFYTIITPVLNPLIYSLRNKDVTGALRSRMQSGLNLRKVVKRKS